MNTLKILDDEIKDLKISSLPNRPTADEGFGGKGFSPDEMKAAFDRLPLFIAERFNALVDALFADGNELSDNIKTGIGSDHTLKDLFSDITSGLFATYLPSGSQTLEKRFLEIESRLSAVESTLNTNR